MSTTVIGNGPSRQAFDLYGIKHFTIGCNAIYRDFEPSVLIASDPAMIREIMAYEYYYPCVFREHEGMHYRANVETFPNHYKIRSSGLFGVDLALEIEPEENIYCIGFDFDFGGNVYEGTDNYGKRNGGAVREFPLDLAKKCMNNPRLKWVSDYKCEALEKNQISLAEYGKIASDHRIKLSKLYETLSYLRISG